MLREFIVAHFTVKVKWKFVFEIIVNLAKFNVLEYTMGANFQ